VAYLGESTSSQNSTAPAVPQEDLSEVHPSEQPEVCSVPNHGEDEAPKEQTRHEVLEEMQKVFASGANFHFQHYYACVEKNCNKLSETERSRFVSNHSRDRFVHSWLGDKSLSFCQQHVFLAGV